MRSVRAFLVAVFVSILSIGSPAAANDSCNGAQAMCPAQGSGPVRLAADYSVKPHSKSERCACLGTSGIERRKCQCECQGTSRFPCQFMPAHFPVPESCSCQ